MVLDRRKSFNVNTWLSHSPIRRPLPPLALYQQACQDRQRRHGICSSLLCGSFYYLHGYGAWKLPLQRYLMKHLVKAPFPVREIGPVLTLLHACHIP
jgi:hypothetical protein